MPAGRVARVDRAHDPGCVDGHSNVGIIETMAPYQSYLILRAACCSIW